jgi:hypothetical protein
MMTSCVPDPMSHDCPASRLPEFPFQIGNSSRPLADSPLAAAEGEQIRMSWLFAAAGVKFEQLGAPGSFFGERAFRAAHPSDVTPQKRQIGIVCSDERGTVATDRWV